MRAAVAQLRSTANAERNLELCGACAECAARRGARLLCLPEAFAFVGEGPDQTVAAATALDSSDFARFRRLAAEHSMWVSLGGLHVPAGDGKRVRNAHIVLAPDGAVAARYDKVRAPPSIRRPAATAYAGTASRVGAALLLLTATAPSAT